MARIITVGFKSQLPTQVVDMSYIRWLSISRELSQLGHEVDIATNHEKPFWSSGFFQMGPNIRQVPLGKVRWENYDVVKTVYQRGFETLEQYGGSSHPFILARMSGVVDQEDREGIYFTGERRRWLYSVQEKIQRQCHSISLTTEPARALWTERFGDKNRILVVPGAAATDIPPKRKDPYPSGEGYRCLFAGNIFDTLSQREVNERLTHSLNSLGRRLRQKKIQLFVIGSGDTSRLDPRWVTHLGAIPYPDSWDYFYFASAGVALQWGNHPNQNELTKIYYYLRVGLPVICESGFPNEDLIETTQMGYIVENGNLALLAEQIEQAVRRTDWPKGLASEWIAKHHTWRNRAEIYHRILLENHPHSKSSMGFFRKAARKFYSLARS